MKHFHKIQMINYTVFSHDISVIKMQDNCDNKIDINDLSSDQQADIVTYKFHGISVSKVDFCFSISFIFHMYF